MSNIPDGPGLHGFEARQSDDDVKRDLELIHVECGTHVCDIEPGDTLGVLVSVAEDHARICTDLAWYTAESADAENHDQEADLNAIGSPGGASWASVSPDGQPGYQPWAWVIYDRWLDVDDDPDPTLAQGRAYSEDEAKAAVAAWIASARRAADMEAEEN